MDVYCFGQYFLLSFLENDIRWASIYSIRQVFLSRWYANILFTQKYHQVLEISRPFLTHLSKINKTREKSKDRIGLKGRTLIFTYLHSLLVKTILEPRIYYQFRSEREHFFLIQSILSNISQKPQINDLYCANCMLF